MSTLADWNICTYINIVGESIGDYTIDRKLPSFCDCEICLAIIYNMAQ